MMRLQTLFTSVALLGAAALAAAAQQSAPQLMGTVATQDAVVTGGLEVQGGNARLLTNASVTAGPRTAAVSLARGGQVLVCSTSEFHLLHAGAGQALLFGLDRGALELHTLAEAHDVILTPDIRFTIEATPRDKPASFDLRLRVTRNGDTCVDNAGAGAPVLQLNGAFGGSSYRLMPGQHVLFEHGNLREVVDHERSSCGCPPPAGALSAADGAHPFPEAQSEGLTAEAPAQNSIQTGEKGTQISQTFVYGEGVPGAGAPPTGLPSAAAGTGKAAKPHGFFHAIGGFFHRLFHPGDEAAH